MRRLGLAVLVLIAAVTLLAVGARLRSSGGRDPDRTAIEDGPGTRLEPIPGALEEAKEDAAAPRRTAEEASRPLPNPNEGAAAFRGRVLDAGTGEPVPHLAILVGDAEFAVDAAGAFASEAPLPENGRPLIVFDAFRRWLVETLDRDRIERAGAESIVRVTIGPTYFLRFAGTHPAESDGLLGRLVERPASGAERASLWAPLPRIPETFLRLDRPWEPAGADSGFEVQVRSEEGELFGASARLSQVVGIHPGLVEIRLERALGILIGRVVDPEGRPQLRASLVALPLGESMPSSSPGSWPEATTDAAGAFRFAPLPPGAYEVLARPPGPGKPARRRAIVEAGTNDLGDLVVEPAVSAGSIRGRLEAPIGSRPAHTDRVRLRAVEGGLERFAKPDFVGKSRSASFAFDGLPAGEYEVAAVSPFGARWKPERALVRVPANDVVFVREDVARENVCVDVVDARTDAPLPFSYSARVDGSTLPLADKERDGTYCLSVPTESAVAWRIWAPGYRSVRLTREDFSASPEGLGARVRLSPGFDATIRALDFGDGVEAGDPSAYFAAVSRPGIEGVEIRADGAVLARTGPDGSGSIDLDREPARIEVAAPGWRSVASRDLADGRITGSRHDVVVWMVRED